mmetsp:Transcript_3780/g.13633  ORF Transcript_3780/g.13633 Transcript_3780/m.13633 type:complete len:95 (-) Transcript_3780:36-320(-)
MERASTAFRGRVDARVVTFHSCHFKFKPFKIDARVCRCIEPSGCVEGCICTCSKCTARKGCLWRSVLKRLPRWFQLVSLTLNATLCCDAHPRAV